MEQEAFVDVSLDVLCEFFEVAIHCILSTREIYPNGIFEKRRKYGIPVQMSIHPELNEYITKCVKSLRPLLLKDEITAVVVVILDPSDKAVERFVFEIANFKEEMTPCTHSLADIERLLRSVCLKIATSTAELSPLPSGCHFTVQVHTRNPTLQDPKMEIVDENACWIPPEPLQAELNHTKIIPLKTAHCSMFKMQLFVERRDAT